MATEPFVAPLTGRPVRRHPRIMRRVPGMPRRTGDGLPPAPRTTEEDLSPQRPTLKWVLTTDSTGRTRPEARWI